MRPEHLTIKAKTSREMYSERFYFRDLAKEIIPSKGILFNKRRRKEECRTRK